MIRAANIRANLIDILFVLIILKLMDTGDFVLQLNFKELQALRECIPPTMRVIKVMIMIILTIGVTKAIIKYNLDNDIN